MAKKKPVQETGVRHVGEVVMRPLEDVEPNGWNPNRMTDFERESLASGLRKNGWLMSQSLTIWGKDDRGRQRDLIIDGEQRWTVAREIGFTEGPMVTLDGLTKTQAMALTIELDSKRGTFEEDELAKIVKRIALEVPREDLGMDLGFDPNHLKLLLDESTFVQVNGHEREVRLDTTFQVVITVKDETEQRGLIEYAQQKGWKCRAVI